MSELTEGTGPVEQEPQDRRDLGNSGTPERSFGEGTVMMAC